MLAGGREGELVGMVDLDEGGVALVLDMGGRRSLAFGIGRLFFLAAGCEKEE